MLKPDVALAALEAADMAWANRVVQVCFGVQCAGIEAQLRADGVTADAAFVDHTANCTRHCVEEKKQYLLSHEGSDREVTMDTNE